MYIMHKYDGEPYSYSIDLEGYIALERVEYADSEREIEALEVLSDIEDIEDISPADLARIKILHIIRKKITGRDLVVICNDSFQDIVDVVTDYNSSYDEED